MLQASDLAPLSSVYATTHSSPVQEKNHGREMRARPSPKVRQWRRPRKSRDSECCSSVTKRARHWWGSSSYQRAGGASRRAGGEIPPQHFVWYRLPEYGCITANQPDAYLIPTLSLTVTSLKARISKCRNKNGCVSSEIFIRGSVVAPFSPYVPLSLSCSH